MIASQCVPYVLQESHTLNGLQSRLHGLDHWWRVWKNAQMLVGEDVTQVDLQVVALYALFHDSMRLNEGEDPEHAVRGYKLWERYYLMRNLGRFVTHQQGELLFEAIIEHSKGFRSTNPTIAVCWDADRMDLHRKGIWPEARYLSTETALSLAMTRIAP